MNLRIEKR
uniref:Uncharacterized protein n=1 Tax=Rhizophora mucronata TaxID=61149 RepID=A0A2P2JGV7_RHIMU